MEDQHKLKLNNGAHIPIVGLGTWKSKEGEVEAAVKAAIDAGYRHFDCAWVYGNEDEIGRALHDKIQNHVIKREDIFVTSKLWNTYHRKDLVEVNLRQTLTSLRLDYLDLYLIHWPMAYKEGGEAFPLANGKTQYSDVHFTESWAVLEELHHKGLIKAIGVSNFNKSQLQELITFAKVKPSVLQIELHPYLPQKELVQFCHDNGIIVTAYSPLGSPDRPPRMVGQSDPELLKDPVVNAIAKKA